MPADFAPGIPVMDGKQKRRNCVFRNAPKRQDLYIEELTPKIYVSLNHVLKM